MKRYSEEQILYLKLIVPGRKFAEVTELFNAKFNENKTIIQIKELCKRKKIRSGLDLSFKKDCERTKHIISKSMSPLGCEVATSDGYLKIKISDSPSLWKLKQIAEWEKYNGVIPSGYVVTFLDGNKQNCSIDNLKLIRKNQLSKINRLKLRYFNEESLETCCLIAELKTKTNDITKAHK